MIKIVVLDNQTVTANNDLDYSELHKLGNVFIYDKLTMPKQIIDKIQDAMIIIVNKVIINKEIIDNFPASVKMIAISATGYDNVDVAYAKQKNIAVTNTPDYGTNSVAQLAMFLITACAINLPMQQKYLNSGWNKDKALEIPMREVSGKTLGIVGYGNIGKKIAKLAQAYDMNIVVYNRSKINDSNVNQVNLEDLAKISDYISLSLALNQDTANIINKQIINKMKRSAYIINTARGGLINESDLIDALLNNAIAGAALDVLAKEPPMPDNKLLTLPNVILTQHIGWGTIEARQKCINIVIDNIRNFINNQPTNLVN